MEAVDRALGIHIKGVSEETTEADLQSTFSQFGAVTETVIKGERGWAGGLATRRRRGAKCAA